MFDFFGIKEFIYTMCGIAVIAVVYFLFFGAGEPFITVEDANVYEYNEFLFEGEATELGLDGGIGNYFKYNGDYQFGIKKIDVEDVISVEVTVDGIVNNIKITEFYNETFTNVNSLSFVGEFPRLDFYDDDFEEAKLTITVTYLGKKDNELQLTKVVIINIDEDFF